MDCSL